jgi:hypothetical protein
MQQCSAAWRQQAATITAYGSLRHWRLAAATAQLQPLLLLLLLQLLLEPAPMLQQLGVLLLVQQPQQGRQAMPH